MFYYTLGYSYWDESGVIFLMHEVEFSKEEFINFVAEVTPALAKKFQKESIEYAESRVGTEEMSKGMEKITLKYAHLVKFSDIYDKVTDELCSRFGFKRVPYSAQISVWNEDLFDAGGDEDEALQKIRKSCQK